MKVRSKMITMLFMLCLVFSLALSACSTVSKGTDAPKTSDEPSISPEVVAKAKEFPKGPVTLKVAAPWGQDLFMQRIGKPIVAKYPNITFELINWNGTVEKLQEINGKGIIVDLLLAFRGQKALEDLDMVYPLDDMVKAYNTDLSKVDPSVIANFRSRDSKGRLIGFPEAGDTYGLYYNKEIFDKFGVPYPKAGMTWDETLELAKKLTAERDGVKYRGLTFGVPEVPLLQLSAAKSDADSGEVLLTKDPKFAKYMELMRKYFSIPGMYITDKKELKKNNFESKTIAMHIDYHGYLTWFGEKGNAGIEYKKNFDILPIPTWTDLPNIAPEMGAHPWVISSFSKNKDAAYQVLTELISNENQTKLSREGNPPVVKDSTILTLFGADDPTYKGKNVMAFFENDFAASPAKQSNWDRYVDIDTNKFAASDMNIQEFLRQSSEAADAKIKEAKAKK